MSEWLRRWTRNPLGSAREGSNPFGVVFPPFPRKLPPDLSFNNIREVTGLDHLKNLEDLSLFHNHIDEIKGLDGCKKLNVLSLGRNRISDLKQINYLRKFPNLRCICLEHNKICSSDSYRQHTLAYLPHLTYLDYMLVDKKQVAHIQVESDNFCPDVFSPNSPLNCWICSGLSRTGSFCCLGGPEHHDTM